MTAEAASTNPGVPATAQLSLHLPGRILVAAVIAAGLPLGVQSPVTLVWFVPSAGVGALLAVRRPVTSIGWQLLALAWCFLLGTMTIDATPDALIAGTAPWTVAALAVTGNASQAGVLYLLSVLAITFPSGRMPVGRWAEPTRVAFGMGLALLCLALVSPTIQVAFLESGTATVPNPIALAPGLPVWRLLEEGRGSLAFFALLVFSVLSLLLRFRRSRGIERQQLRWFGASLLLVASLAVVFVLLVLLSLLSVVPGGVDTEFIPYLAIPIFASVPVSIGIAVLRYRLYEIDTLINRAVVYGLLTAILAGVSAAAIAIGQRVFQGVAGPGSEVTMVVATLLVVTIFTPIKNRLQAIVDRRFKETRDPAADLAAFVAEVRRSFGPPTLDRTMRPLLEVAVAAYGASGGEVRIGGDPRQTMVVGAVGAEPSAVVSTPAGPMVVELRLFGSEPARDLGPLRLALDAVIAETTGRPAVLAESAHTGR